MHQAIHVSHVNKPGCLWTIHQTLRHNIANYAFNCWYTHMCKAFIVNSYKVTGCIFYDIKIILMWILCADYRINSNTNVLVPCSNMSMTWLCGLQGIGAIVTYSNLMGVIESVRFQGVRTTWEKLLRGQKQKERVREKGRQCLLFIGLRGPAAAAFIIQMLQHDTELIQPLVNTATRGPVPQTFTWLVLPTQISESSDLLWEKLGREIGRGDNVIACDTSL